MFLILSFSLWFLFLDLTDGHFRSKIPHSLAPLFLFLFSLPHGEQWLPLEVLFPQLSYLSGVPPHHPSMASCLQIPKSRSMPPFTLSLPMTTTGRKHHTAMALLLLILNNLQSPLDLCCWSPIISLVFMWIPLILLSGYSNHLITIPTFLDPFPSPLLPPTSFSRWPHHPPSL